MPTLAWTMPDEDLSHIAPDVIGHFTGQGLRDTYPWAPVLTCGAPVRGSSHGTAGWPGTIAPGDPR